MDRQFDRLAREMAGGTSRRHVLRGVLAGFGATLLSAVVAKPALATHCSESTTVCGVPDGKHKCCPPDKSMCCKATDTGAPMCCPPDPGLIDICLHGTQHVLRTRQCI
jgi:hypothetical protein